jgi:hypothetical protein
VAITVVHKTNKQRMCYYSTSLELLNFPYFSSHPLKLALFDVDDCKLQLKVGAMLAVAYLLVDLFLYQVKLKNKTLCIPDKTDKPPSATKLRKTDAIPSRKCTYSQVSRDGQRNGCFSNIIVMCMPIARQRLGKRIPAKRTHATEGRPLLGTEKI